MTDDRRPPLPPQRPVELLAPAGNMESLRAAVENGADAVYLGGEAFNARKFAANFSDEELQEAIDHCHVRGVRVFVTLNTLIKNHEFYEAVRFIEKVRRFGADAVIVQDLGIMRAVHTLAPDLPLHLSTQATVHNSAGIRFLEDLGAERVILARENSMDEMARMRERTGAELEQFVHGAMCYCYSGQCLMSSLIGGRSGNRGACAYTCRLPYTMEEAHDQVDLEDLVKRGAVETVGDEEDPDAPSRSNVTFLDEGTPPPWAGREKAPNGATLPQRSTPGFLADPGPARTVPGTSEKHIISARDMNTLELVDQHIDAGVTSFKIEGRMKRPEYVATVTRAYRNAIDSACQGRFEVDARDADAVRRIFNREFNRSWLEGKELWSFTNWDTAGNQGVPVGTVVESGKGWVQVALNDTLRVKDGIEIEHRPENWEKAHRSRPDGAPGAPEEYGFTVTQMLIDDRYVTEAGAGEVVELRGHQWSAPGDPVYKTADIEVLERARDSYQQPPWRTVPVELYATIRQGQPLRVRLRDARRGIEVEHEHDYVVQQARSAPLTRENAADQLDRLGDTPFHATRVRIDLGEQCFVPISELNAARREAAQALERTLAEAYHRPPREDQAEARSLLLDHARVERDPDRPLQLTVNCFGLPNLKAALAGGADTVYYSPLPVGGLQPKWDLDALERGLALAEEHGATLWLTSGMVQKDHEVAQLRRAVQAHRDRIAGVVAGHHGAIQVALEEGLPVVTDWPLNVYNSLTIDQLAQRIRERDPEGLERVTISPELTLEDVEGLAGHTAARLEVLAHGRLTLMTSEYCSIGHATDCQLPGGSWAPCHDSQFQLRDRKGKAFPLQTDGACRMYILNSVELNMIDRLGELREAGVDAVRIETIGTEPKAVQAQVEAYRAALDDLVAGRSFDRENWDLLEAVCDDGFTTGHFYRGPL